VINTSIQQLDKREGKRKLRSGWHVVRFDQMAESILDRVDKPSEADVAYYVGLEHLDPESLKIRRWGTPDDVEATKLRFKPGDIIFGRRRAYQRKVAVAEFEGICSAHALVLRAREETVLKEFLPFFIQNDTFFERALSISVGSLSPTINWKTLAKQEFLIPPKDEQRRIADILWAADDTIIKWEQVLQGSIALRSSLIDTCISYNQELPDLQSYNEYLIVKLHEVCLRITDGTHLPPQFAPKGIPFLLVSNLTSGKVDWNVSKWITEETYKELTKRVKPEVGDVLYTVVGSFGIPILITWDKPFAFQRHIAILKPKRDLLDGSYLTYFLESNLGKTQAELTAVGNAQKTITLGSLNNFKIPLPPLNEQKQIVKRIDRVNNTIAAASQHIQVVKSLKGEVLQQLMAGR
jgi:type I restriction enzyme, S subunit